jgi:hypothetical protein
MIKLLLTTLLQYVEKELKRIRASNDNFTIVVYEIVDKQGIPFTRIDIFTK